MPEYGIGSLGRLRTADELYEKSKDLSQLDTGVEGSGADFINRIRRLWNPTPETSSQYYSRMSPTGETLQ